MEILVIPNALKGSLSSTQFCLTAPKTLQKKYSVKTIPVSDGGDGFIDSFQYIFPQSKKYKTTVLNAMRKKHYAPYLMLPDNKTCVIETAKICGLGNMQKLLLKPLYATSYGVGQVIKTAAKKGARVFYIGLGGVACNDGGAGMAAAAGWKLTDARGKLIKLGADNLLKLAKISDRPKWTRGLKFIGISDVKNPLLGTLGSAAVYGPQKGANKKQVAILERALSIYAKIIKKNLNKDIDRPRCGAAGAIAAGLYGLFNARLLDGGNFVLKHLNAASKIKRADIIITAEGKLDKQTFYGKMPQTICRLAVKYQKTVIFVCGKCEIKNKNLFKKYGIVRVIELSSYAKDIKDSIKNARKYLTRALKANF